MVKAWEILKKFFLLILIIFFVKMIVESPAFQKEFKSFSNQIKTNLKSRSLK